MDRTSEFFATVESLRSRAQSHLPADKRRLLTPAEQNASASGVTAGKSAASNRQRTEFAMMATNIGKDIQLTGAKLQKLAKLAKRKTLFDDRPVEISELIFIIKQDIAKLNKQIAHLQGHVREQNQSTLNAKQAMEHSSNVVVMLQSRLASATSGFKDVLELRTENMKATKGRREQFMSSTQQQASTFSSDSPLYNLERKPAAANEPPKDVLSLDFTTPSQTLHQQQVQLVDSNNQYIESRSNAIEAIESTLQELGGIFQQLAQMVSEQRDMVQRIDANTDDIESNVVGAQNELLKYYSYVSSNRWLFVKVFAVVVTSAVTMSVLS